MPAIARTRADVELRSGPKSGGGIVDRLPGDCPVEILEDMSRWYKVKPTRLMHGASGYLPAMALTFPTKGGPVVFPEIQADGQIKICSVPAALKLSVFLQWLVDGGKPAWLPEKIWAVIENNKGSELLAKIREASIKIQPRWDGWVASIKENFRIEEATMNEWITMMEGGREVYAIRDHYVYMTPVHNSSYHGCALRGQVMRWTGNVRVHQKDGVRRSFYEVDFYRLSRTMHGWFRADVAAEYVFPDPGNDPTIESNSSTVFDLYRNILRHPQDEEMAETKKKGFYAAQYIDVFEATKRHLVHFSLCGEFCVAALSGGDVLPLLKKWLDSKYLRAKAILGDPHEGTSAGDLQTLLEVAGLKGEIYKSIPTTPQFIKERLAAGQRVIVGCGINSGGKIKAGGRIRHWVILEDVIPSGNSGWVRVYNPFQNREEVYNYNSFLASAGVGTGLWIHPKSGIVEG